jgi:hypothetical protein
MLEKFRMELEKSFFTTCSIWVLCVGIFFYKYFQTGLFDTQLLILPGIHSLGLFVWIHFFFKRCKQEVRFGYACIQALMNGLDSRLSDTNPEGSRFVAVCLRESLIWCPESLGGYDWTVPKIDKLIQSCEQYAQSTEHRIYNEVVRIKILEVTLRALRSENVQLFKKKTGVDYDEC